jgi:segregation and condensation protein B
MSRPIHTDTRVLRPIIEALIFASEEPLPPRVLVRLLAGERDDPKGAAIDPDELAAADAGDADASGEVADASDVVAGASGEVASASDGVADESGEVTRASDEITSASDEVASAADEVEAAVDAVDEQSEIVAEQPVSDDDVDGMRLADGSESADALATAYVDLSRDYSERLFPEEQIVTIDQRLVRRLIDDLNAEYEETSRAFRIVEVAGGFQFATVREFGEYVALLSKEKQRRRLSPAALETLAIIAFRQPISKPEIEAIRGVNSDQVLLSLLEKTLVAITGRSESVGRPLLYGTTEEFLRIFGLNSLNELPKLREIEELMEEDAYSAERIEVVNVDPSSDAEQIEAIVGAAGAEREDAGDEPESQDTDAVDESPYDETIDESPESPYDETIDESPDQVEVAADLEEIAHAFSSDTLTADDDGDGDEGADVGDGAGDRTGAELDEDRE